MSIDIYFKLLDDLKSRSDLIKYFDVTQTLPPVDSQQVIKLAENPTKIFIHNNNLCYKDENGDIICCPYIETNVSDAGYWLSDKIPPPSFDILQSGNLRKADESESCYICCVIASVLNDDVFLTEIKDLISTYNFNEMGDVTKGKSFNLLLVEWLDLQSVIISIIVSACKYAISSQKKDSEQFLRNGLEKAELDALRDLALKIKSVNFNWSTGKLSPDNVKNLTKIEILQYIDERNKIINDLLNESKYGELYRTVNLSTEYINPIIKKKISNWVCEEVDKLYTQDQNLSSIYGDRSIVASKVRKRALKIARGSVIRENILRYIEDKENYRMPRKL